MQTSHYLGECYCGGVKFSCDGAPFFTQYCHCNKCREIASHSKRDADKRGYAWTAGYLTSNFKIISGTDILEEIIKNNAKLLLCKSCHSLIYGISLDKNKQAGIGINVNNFDFINSMPESFKSIRHIWYVNRVVNLNDNLPKFKDAPKEQFGSGELWVAESKDKLGLPFEYQKMPEYFDAHNISEQTEAKNALIEKLLKEQKVKTVLDMTCGTGSQVFYLSDRGYKVIGSDFSPALLDQARIKAKKMSLDLTFIDGDMRDIRVGKFDAVITIFNAIGHLTKLDFEKALQNVRANLKDGGVYIFDILNLQAITDNVIDSFAIDIKSNVNGVNIRNIQHSEIDRENGLLISHDHYTISKEKVNRKYTKTVSVCKFIPLQNCNQCLSAMASTLLVNMTWMEILLYQIKVLIS